MGAQSRRALSLKVSPQRLSQDRSDHLWEWSPVTPVCAPPLRYDIKGCELSRWVEPAPEGSPILLVLKDLNFQGKTMKLGESQAVSVYSSIQGEVCKRGSRLPKFLAAQDSNSGEVWCSYRTPTELVPPPDRPGHSLSAGPEHSGLQSPDGLSAPP